MNVNTLASIISQSRLQSYVTSQGTKPENAVALYEQNIALAQSFYPLLSSLEVALRNALDEQCTTLFSDPDWLINQKTGFMSDRKLTHPGAGGRMVTNTFLKRSVEDAEVKLRKQNKPITQGRIISELTFGFWTELFDRTHYSLLKGVPIRAFTNLPPTVKRTQIYTTLNDIRRFRNRIYHNEPICFLNAVCSTGPAFRIRNEIGEMLQWLSFDLPSWVAEIDESEFELILTERYSPIHKPLTTEWRVLIAKLKSAVRILSR